MVDPTPFLPITDEELAALAPDALSDHLAAAVAAFDLAKAADVIDAAGLTALTELATHIKVVRAESDKRVAEAQEALDQINALDAEVHGESDAPADGDPDPVDPEDTPAEGDPDDADPAVEATDPAPVEAEPAGELVTASARPLDMAALRRRQPARPAPSAPAGRALPQITAAADVPGMSTGQNLNMESLVRGVTERANGLKHSGRANSALVASYAMQFPANLQVNEMGAPAGTAAVLAASDQSRLPQGDIVASGGWCALSETIYEISDVACPDMLWSAPEIQLTRGGINFYQTPTLNVSALTWVHTEANDIANATKPCFSIPCPTPTEVRCDAYGVCLESGILTERFFPELTAWYVRNAMVAHEIQISTGMFAAAAASATHYQVVDTFAAFTAVFGAVALQAADLIEKHSLCQSTSVEVVFPYWAQNLFLSDIARQNGRDLSEVDPGIITRAFATLGVAVQFARGLNHDVPSHIGGATPAMGWPDHIPFLIYPAGAFQIGRGPQVDLGAVYDSSKFVTNDYTALFTEECVALVNRGPEARYVTVPVCADGSTGAINTKTAHFDCPIDAGGVNS